MSQHRRAADLHALHVREHRAAAPAEPRVARVVGGAALAVAGLWLTDDRFATPAGRHTHHDTLDEGIANWTAGRDRLSAMRALQSVGVPAMPVMSSGDLLDDEHLRSRGYFRESSRPVIGRHVHGVQYVVFGCYEGCI